MLPLQYVVLVFLPFLFILLPSVDDVRFIDLLCPKVSSLLNMKSQDSVGMTPLHWACTEGSVPHVAALLRYGAIMESRDNSGCTPLLIASQYGHVEVVAYLLQKGADGKSVDSSRDSALHWAAYKGSIHVCGLLLFRGELCWTTADAYGQSPLHLASLRGHTTTVRYLLQEGTRSERKQLLFSQDKNGRTPLDLAVHRKRPTVEAVLRTAMEKFDPRRGRLVKQIQSTFRQFFSWHSWKLWIGLHASNDEVDEVPKMPFYWFIFHLFFFASWYPLVFLPSEHEQGILYDLMGWHYTNMAMTVVLFYALYKTHVTCPGVLDEKNPLTHELRKKYEETLESYADESSFSKQKAVSGPKQCSFHIFSVVGRRVPFPVHCTGGVEATGPSTLNFSGAMLRPPIRFALEFMIVAHWGRTKHSHSVTYSLCLFPVMYSFVSFHFNSSCSVFLCVAFVPRTQPPIW